jgi:hypothetical protein
LATKLLTIGQVGQHFRDQGYRVQDWQVRRIYERRILPEPGRCGIFRVISISDLPKVEEALRRAGYLQGEEVVRAK